MDLKEGSVESPPIGFGSKERAEVSNELWFVGGQVASRERM
jgi:hypothetical protein